MIQNILLTSLTPLKEKDEINCWENRPFTTVWPENKIQHKTKDITKTIKKKQKRVRTAFSTEQLRALERTYSRHKYIDSEKRAELAKSLNIGDKCIKIWFQNRRMKEKKESSESSCDSSTESVSNDTPSVPASPQLQVIPDIHESSPVQYSHYSHSENYQFHPNYNMNPPPAYRGVQTPSFPTYFYTDSNIYPTHYYPIDTNYSNGEGGGYNQYGSEINNCWSSNNYTYYTQM